MAIAPVSTTPAVPALPPEPAPKRRGGLNRNRRLWVFLLPAAAIYAFIVLWPSIQGTGLAFTNWDGLSPRRDFIGLDNFFQLVRDPKAAGAIIRTLIIAFTITIVQNLVGLLLALGVNTNIKSRNVLRVMFFAPAIITPVATAYLWQ